MATRKPRKGDMLPELPDSDPLPTTPAEFMDKHAGHVLNAALIQAYEDPGAAKYLVEKVFGTGGWHNAFLNTVSADAGPAALQAAMDRAVDAYVAGKIDAQCVGMLTKVLTARLDALTVPATP